MIKALLLSAVTWFFPQAIPMTSYPVNGGVAFDFPQAPNHVNAFAMSARHSLSGSITAQFTVTADPTTVFNFHMDDDPANTCPGAAELHLILFGSHWFTDPNAENLRWYSTVRYVLGPADVQLKVPLTPDGWTSVFGQHPTDSAAALSGWQATLKKPDSMGFAFGGGCFYGHGVNVSGGNASFIVWAFQ